MKVVCLINTRNHARFIDECVQSCLRQEVPQGCVYEVHAVDAGSTDGTLARLQTFGDAVTHYARPNIGQSGAFNLCIEINADIFMFCDGDDRLHPERLRRIVAQFIAHPDVVLVGNSINEVNADGNLIRRVYVETDQYLDAGGSDAVALYSARCLMGTSRLAVRKNSLMKILPFDRTILFEADEYIFNLLPNFGIVCILGATLTDYRLHDKNNYQNNKPSLERTQRYRKIHEELLACMIQMRIKHQLTGQYLDLCEKGLHLVCKRTQTFESALQSRIKAINVIWHEPEILGLVRALNIKKSFYAIIIIFFGLFGSLSIYYFLRELFASFSSATREKADARLL